MSRPVHILLQTTIEYASNDWHIERFSMLRDLDLNVRHDTVHTLSDCRAVARWRTSHIRLADFVVDPGRVATERVRRSREG